jgi:hypothetical protein
MIATRESVVSRHGDHGALIEAVVEPTDDAILGWPITVSVFNHYNYTPTVEVSRWPEGEDPNGDPEHTFDLTADGAVTLALKLIAIAATVRQIERDRSAQRAADEAIDAVYREADEP